jgi:methyltransferase family protein
VTNTSLSEPVTGEITATPNPVCFGQRCVISWHTNDPIGAEVRVSTASDDEQLVIQGGKSGQVEIPWITDSKVYEFRLYPASRPDIAIGSVKARREIESAPSALREIADEVTRGNIDVMELSTFIAAVLPRCIHSERFRDIFSLWERRGFHVTPVHFYQPIPDTQSLPQTLWNRPSELIGINMNDSKQLDLLRNHFPKFRHEYEKLPAEPPPGQKGPFRGVDVLSAYCMVRHFQPRLIVEVGSGFSSRVLGTAATKNKSSGLVCIDPFPGELTRKGSIPGLKSFIEKQVQDIDLEFFSQLQARDILFIDSSHTVKIGGDVNYLFLEVLPRLNDGVIVHVHDIFLPFEYRRDWVMDELRFWSEQYLLQAFLTFNSAFEVLLANNYLNCNFHDDLVATFSGLTSYLGGSFWMWRRPSKQTR